MSQCVSQGTIMSKAKKLREFLRTKDLIRIVGAHNGLTAKLVERHGFDGIWASGFEISASHGVPDANILTMTDHLNAAISMNDATSIPVIADCDTGWGNANNVIRLVNKFEAAGIAAVCIEDKKFPKSNSLLADGRQEIAPISEFVGKIMAAKNAQESKDFMVFARIEALIAGWGQKEALKRANAYVDAGADGIFIHSKSKTPDDIIRFVKAWDNKTPVILCPTTYYTLTEDKMKELGIKMVIYANHGIRASIKAVNDILGEIHDHGITNLGNRITDLKEVFELQGTDKIREYERMYLRTGYGNVKVVIPAAGDDSKRDFGSILVDTPIAMLDINGTSILQRNIDIMRSLGIRDITVIGGYNIEKINVDGVNFIENKDYKNTHHMHSVMLAEKELTDKTLIVFSDIVFERDIIEKLLKTENDITVVIDKSYKTSKVRKPDIDLVTAKYEPIVEGRVISSERDNPILKIGKNISKDKANYEFVGIALFSKKGIEILKKEYNELIKNPPESLPEAKDVNMVTLNDMLQILIDKGYKVSSMEINTGWSEVHNLDDYKRVSNMLAY
jgi:phosphoenolpyruvate phosphomutase